MPGTRGESVLFETWYDGLDALQGSPEQRKFWSDLLAIRDGAAKLLEGMRNAGQIGAALEAEVTLYRGCGDCARELERSPTNCASSSSRRQLTLDADATAPADARWHR